MQSGEQERAGSSKQQRQFRNLRSRFGSTKDSQVGEESEVKVGRRVVVGSDGRNKLIEAERGKAAGLTESRLRSRWQDASRAVGGRCTRRGEHVTDDAFEAAAAS